MSIVTNYFLILYYLYIFNVLLNIIKISYSLWVLLAIPLLYGKLFINFLNINNEPNFRTYLTSKKLFIRMTKYFWLRYFMKMKIVYSYYL